MNLYFKNKSSKLIVSTLIAIIWIGPVKAGQDTLYTVLPLQDTYVYNYPNDATARSTAYGTESEIKLRSQSKSEGYFVFDVTDIPDGAKITSAKLKLYCTSAKGADNAMGEVTAYKVSGTDWDEHTFTWNKMNENKAYHAGAIIPEATAKVVSGGFRTNQDMAKASSQNKIIEIDLANYIVGNGKYGLCLKLSNIGYFIHFGQKENIDKSKRPVLEIICEK